MDVSANAVEHCRRSVAGKAGRRFVLVNDYADGVLRVGVGYHPVEDCAFDVFYIHQLFAT